MTLGSLAGGLLLESRSWLLVTVTSVAALAACLIAATAMGHRLYCSVCANPVFVVRKCRKHQRAKKFLGVSHRLGVAASALITQRYHCMYCGEKIPLEMAAPRKEPARPDRAGRSAAPAIVTATSELPPRRS